MTSDVCRSLSYFVREHGDRKGDQIPITQKSSCINELFEMCNKLSQIIKLNSIIGIYCLIHLWTTITMKTINCLQFCNLTNLAIVISVSVKCCLLSLLPSLMTGCDVCFCKKCLLWGVPGPGGCVSAWGRCLLSGGGVSGPGGGSVCLWSWGMYPSMQWGRHPPQLWTDRHL